MLGLGPSALLTLIRVPNPQELRVQSQRSRVPLVAWGFPWPKGELIHTLILNHPRKSALTSRNVNHSWLSTTQTRL